MTVDGEYEYFIAVRAKAGDKIAFNKLWKAYRPIMMGMLRCCAHLTPGEKESEAALVFTRKLELFDPAKVNKSPGQWTFSYMLTGGMKNTKKKLMTALRRDSVVSFGIKETRPDISFANSDYPVSCLRFIDVVDINQYDYFEKNNPEQYALTAADKPEAQKARELQETLSPFQKAILDFRRAGLALHEVADRMGCSYSKIRAHITKAESLASQIFGFDYRPGYWRGRS